MLSDEIDTLVHELSASLVPSQRSAFEAAARAVLTAAGCSGCGAAYRLLIPVQRAHWDPPPDDRMAHSGARHHRSSKLIDAPALGEDSARVGERDRRRFQAVTE
jgi:hypothetical protein